VDILERSILQTLDYKSIKVKTTKLEQSISFDDEQFDLLVSSVGLTPEEVNRIIDEEKYKAING